MNFLAIAASVLAMGSSHIAGRTPSGWIQLYGMDCLRLERFSSQILYTPGSEAGMGMGPLSVLAGK